MKAIALLAGLLVVHGQFLDVPDWYHYLNSTAVGNQVLKNGVDIQRWDRIGEGFTQETMKPPGLHKLKIPAKKEFPGNGSQYWLITPATYVVTKGSASIKDKDGKEIVLEEGQLFYSPAGVLHGPIAAAPGCDETVVLALAEFPIRFHNVPAYIPTSDDHVTQHAFQPKEDSFAVPPLPGFPDCLRISGGPGAIFVKMKPDCTLPFHYHPTGVFYFFTKGALRVGGDIPGKTVTFPAGVSRWARPGWAYGPEQSIPGDEETWFIALGQPPTTGPSPDVPNFMIRNNLSAAAGSDALQPAYFNSQANGKTGESDPKESKLSQKRARRHLRSNIDDLDESILLQQPYTADDLENEEL